MRLRERESSIGVTLGPIRTSIESLASDGTRCSCCVYCAALLLPLNGSQNEMISGMPPMIMMPVVSEGREKRKRCRRTLLNFLVPITECVYNLEVSHRLHDLLYGKDEINIVLIDTRKALLGR